MNNITKIKKVLSSDRGFVDLQSVMVGIIVSAIVASIAVVGLIGFTRMMSDDNTKTTLKTLNVGLESFYTEKDRFPASITELANGRYVPAAYKNLPITELCYIPAAGTMPQSYTATAKSASTGKFFTTVPDATDTGTATSYPNTGTGTLCKK